MATDLVSLTDDDRGAFEKESISLATNAPRWDARRVIRLQDLGQKSTDLEISEALCHPCTDQDLQIVFLEFLSLFDQERISIRYLKYLSGVEYFKGLFSGGETHSAVLREIFTALAANELVEIIDYSPDDNFAIKLAPQVLLIFSSQYDSSSQHQLAVWFGLMFGAYFRTADDMDAALLYREETSRHLETCLRISKELLHQTNPFVYLEVAYWSAIFDTKQGKNQKALSLLEKTLAIANDHVKYNDWRVLQIQNAIAIPLMELGRCEDAQSLLKQTLAQKLEVCSIDDDRVYQTMTDLADCYMRLERHSLAESITKQVLEKQISRYGEQDLSTLWSMADLGTIYIAQTRWKEAEKLLEKTLILSQVLIEDETNLLIATLKQSTGIVNMHSGSFCNAEMCFRSAYMARQIKLGSRNRFTCESGNGLADALLHVNKLQEAEAILLQNFEPGIEDNGCPSPTSTRAQELLGILRVVQGQCVEAERHFLHVLSCRNKLYGTEHHKTIQAAHNLGWCLQIHGLQSEAQMTYQHIQTTNDILKPEIERGRFQGRGSQSSRSRGLRPPFDYHTS